MLTYAQALRAIFQRTDYERQEQPPYPERVWRLSRVEAFLSALGNPQRAFRSVHIAGTKGKGSTTAMIEAILRAAGYRTGMYTSPHLHTFRERIRLNGELISEADVSRLVEQVLPTLEAHPEVTVFEIITALAMLYHAQSQVDWGVYEVGMGGRLDATNVLHPTATVITSISMDHMKVLGDTLEAIAREKAGIIKAGIPAITAPQRPAAMAVIQNACAERGTRLCVVGEDWHWRFLDADLDGQRFDLYRRGHAGQPDYAGLRIPLLAEHQLENACTAVAAIATLQEQGVSIPQDAVRQGLATVAWPGRLEILARRPLLVVDGAHNAYSIEKLVEALRAYLHYRRLLVVFGAGVTHNPQDLLPPLLDVAHEVYVTQSRHAKATPAPELRAIVEQLGHQAMALSTVRDALFRAMDDASEEDLVLVTGSLFVVAEAREAWVARMGLPPLPGDPPGVYEPLQPDQAR